MANYMWDLGFNWSTDSQLSNGNLVLGKGLVAFSPSPNEVNPDTTALQVDRDQVGFNLFNITNPLPAGNFTLKNLSINFRATGADQEASPFDDSNGNVLTSIPTQLTTVEPNGPSAVFGPQSSFPVWSVVPPIIPVNCGHFEFTVLLTVVLTNGGVTTTKTFEVDPEMIVEGTPSPSDG